MEMWKVFNKVMTDYGQILIRKLTSNHLCCDFWSNNLNDQIFDQINTDFSPIQYSDDATEKYIKISSTGVDTYLVLYV